MIDVDGFRSKGLPRERRDESQYRSSEQNLKFITHKISRGLQRVLQRYKNSHWYMMYTCAINPCEIVSRSPGLPRKPSDVSMTG